MTIVEFARRLRAREISAADMTEECLRRIAAENERLNAFILVMGDEARRQAAEADRELASGRDRERSTAFPCPSKTCSTFRAFRRPPLHECARAHRGTRRAARSPVCDWRAPCWSARPTSTSSHSASPTRTRVTDRRATRYDASRSPGGSSGGSAASLASGMALASLGTDTGGFDPHSLCGVRHGRSQADLRRGLDRRLVPLSTTLDHAGPMATTVADVRLMYRALIGDTGSRSHAAVQASGLRLSLPRTYFCDVLAR